MEKFGKNLLKYCNEVIYKLMGEVNESSNVSTGGHILEKRSERSSGWAMTAGSMCGLPRLVEDQRDGLFGLAADTLEKAVALGSRTLGTVIFVYSASTNKTRDLAKFSMT